MWPDDEKAAENTCCIVKDFEEVWAHFCPPKPCLPLSIDGMVYEVFRPGHDKRRTELPATVFRPLPTGLM